MNMKLNLKMEIQLNHLKKLGKTKKNGTKLLFYLQNKFFHL